MTFAETGTGLMMLSISPSDLGDGRGIVCFDYDSDGDVDVLVANRDGSTRLWRNDGATARGNSLKLRLLGDWPNHAAVGATVEVTTDGRRQIRLQEAGSNYASQNSGEVRFGLGQSTVVDEVRIDWGTHRTTRLSDVEANQVLELTEPSPRSTGCSVGATPGLSARRTRN